MILITTLLWAGITVLAFVAACVIWFVLAIAIRTMLHTLLGLTAEQRTAHDAAIGAWNEVLKHHLDQLEQTDDPIRESESKYRIAQAFDAIARHQDALRW